MPCSALSSREQRKVLWGEGDKYCQEEPSNDSERHSEQHYIS